MTRPDAVVSSPAGTLHWAAAAAINIWRAPAPICRIGIQLFGTAVLPPALCWPYFASRSPCSTVTSFQSTSSSSAMIIGSVVLMPCPISGFLPMMVTLPSGAILMKAFGSSGGGGVPPRPWPNNSTGST